MSLKPIPFAKPHLLCGRSEAVRTINGPAVAKCPLFEGLSDDDLAFAGSSGGTRVLPPNIVLFKQADVPTHLHLIVSGAVRQTQITPAGLQYASSYCGPHDVVGCAAVFGGRPHPATATTTEQSVLVTWSAAHMETLCRRDPTVLRNAITLIGRDGEEALERLREFATENVEQRIARAIGRVAAKIGSSCRPPRSALRLSRQDLAELTGATLFTVSRVMTAWERRGLIFSRRRKVEVLDHATLRDIAAGQMKAFHPSKRSTL